MYSDFLITDPKTGEVSDRAQEDQFVVLFRAADSQTFRPIFHSQKLSAEPKRIPNEPTGRPIWTSEAGAIEFLKEHRQGAAPGSEYRIKNRKGEVIDA
jgi:hypothetical protein